MQKGGRAILKKYRIVLLTLFLWHCMLFSYGSLAQEGQGTADALDVMFVIDTSYSMNDTDKDKISMEMLKLFTDISYSKRTRIGFVAYNDNIEAYAPLMEVSSGKGKEEFKKSLDAIGRTGRTDIGLGLRKGWELLSPASPGRQSMIILLTDGEIDVDSSKNQRTAADSRNDVSDVVHQAAAKGIPIYTIAMGRNGVDLPLLEGISRMTGAANYVADIPQDLLEVFNHIFAVNSKARFVPVAAVIATGEPQEINIKLPYSHVAEGNIIFLSSSALQETQVFSGSQNVSFHNTQYYSTIKILQPKQQEIKIRFKSVPNDVVKVSMLLHYDLEGITLVEGEAKSGQSALIKAQFVDSSTKERIVDKNFYSTFTTMAIIKNLETQEEVKIPMQAADNGWELKHVFRNKGRYSIAVQTNNKFYSETLESIEVNVRDAVPFENIAIGILVIAILAMIYYREKRPKLMFTGKINAYYLKLKHPEEEEVPPLTILLHHFNNQKKINLFEMFSSVHADQGLVEGKKVYFSPGSDKTIVLSHKSLCTIVVGQTVICKNQKYVLHYGDKIYVTFPDHMAEIELHYKGVKSAETLNNDVYLYKNAEKRGL